jgi:hypothetical protein
MALVYICSRSIEVKPFIAVANAAISVEALRGFAG